MPDTYYDNVRKRLANSPVKVAESVDKMQELGLLIDFDDQVTVCARRVACGVRGMAMMHC